MNKDFRFYVTATCGLVSFVIFFAVGLAALFTAIYFENTRSIALFSSTCSFVGAILVARYIINRFKYFNELIKTNEEKKTKPVVQIWSRNGETVVTSDEVYRLSLKLRDQLLVIYPWVSPSFRVRPLIFAVQSGRRTNAISPEQLRAIEDSCSVSVTEMQIPGEGNVGYVIDFAQMWKLIHGADAEPPKV